MESPEGLIKQTSIIVCTVDRMPDLDRCLASLEPFRAAEAEVVVVNNGPFGASVEDIANRHGARVTTEPRRGVSRARNAGIRAASGSILAFLDDDSVADTDWLPLLLAPLRNPQVLAVVGSVWPQTLSDPVTQAFHGMHQAEFPQSQITLEASPEENPFPLRMALIGNANMAFRRDVFDRMGYFDVRFGRGTRIGANEEPEILLAVLLGGGKIVAEPAAKIFHRHSTQWRAFRQWAFRSGCGHTAILTKYYLQKPSLRRAIVRYATSRIFRRKVTPSVSPRKAKIPRLSLLLGSLYGPLAFLLSGKQ